MYADMFPHGLDGHPFSPQDLQTIFRWIRAHAEARVRLTTTGICGVVEICPIASPLPRWCLWRSSDGRLQLDDITLNVFALPYPTLDMALRFVALNLATDAC